MPTIIMTKWPVKIDGSVKAKAMTFLQRLSADDTTPGLHVEPIENAADPRVRTGRVDQFWRAVMFRLDGDGDSHYVVHGVWPHDDAISVARRVRLKVNPVNGLPQIEETVETASPPPAPTPPPAVAEKPLLVQLGRTTEDLVDRLGVPPDVAQRALNAPDEDALLDLAQQHEGWLGLLLLDLATAEPIEKITERLELTAPVASADADADLLTSLRKPAAQAQFAFIDDQDELRRVIEEEDFGAWRIFLHPEQRRYVSRTTSGPFRLSGGAGTGKTVVLVHRGRALARRDPQARIVLTTFTTNLAESLRDSLALLDPRVPQPARLGEAGVHVAGIDSLAASIIRAAGSDIAAAVQAVLGDARSAPTGRAPATRWREVLDASSTSLPAKIANETFLSAEYTLVVLPNRVKNEDDYRRVRRPGRGVALDRAKRDSVWELIAAYRALNRMDGTLDFAEAAAVAAEHLTATGPQADHVLVDEGQDLAPTHWQMLRALVAETDDDLFIAEDSHQRIYGARIVLGRYGIRIVGRSQRLTLNYRTTAQNLRYAMGVLDGGTYVDLEEQPEVTGYRSARSGPPPSVQKAESLIAELDLIADQITTWLADGTLPETIAVLVHDRFQRERVANALIERDVPARSVDRDKPAAGRVLVMTMHRAKGMEFTKVVLADVGFQSAAEKVRLGGLDESERLDAELRARSLTYVAASRARDELVVVQRS
ncbi:UvrD-helicase domain-containing protein [Spirilliplanes yamanashiensis]|uniref:DNA 3'-5' helicase n=1 Tax=Spirilliplanes yamanashiensis TaxID=42233 RepID=A0A8J3Y765_9ACTN|nr:UvrD-helicase domain-containing protein [Spirilliplanes yamanashiensis]MDP9817205.1 superfamily I DNA/RNA helicase [Spirilliplanes yamanashiensis]GIJ03141.1 DNA helicase [Spirilliplanes yamanashiensis]